MPLRSFSKTETILTERRRVEPPLLVMVWMGITALSLTEGSAFFYAVCATAAAAINIWAARAGKELYTRRLFVNIGVLMATAMFIFEAFMGRWLLVAVGHYLMLIQMCKLFERKSNRDYAQMLILSLLTMVAASLMCVEVWFAVIFLLYLVLASYTLMIFTVKRGLDAAANARLANETSPLAPQRIAWNVTRDWPARTLRRRLVFIMLSMLLTGLVVFLIAPRASQLADSALGPTPATTGWSTVVRLGDARQMYESSSVAMKVKVSNLPEGNLPQGLKYLRGMTYTRYEKSGWVQAKFHEEAFRPAPRNLGPTVVQEVTMIRPLLSHLFSSYPTCDIRIKAEQGTLRVEPDMSITFSGGGSLSGTVKYTAYFWPDPSKEEGQRQYLQQNCPYLKEPPQLWVNMEPPVREKVREKARQWCADLLEQRERHPENRDELDIKIAKRIRDRLSSEYTYTLDLSDADSDRDGVEDFLFHMKKGHCEYFASAQTVMCCLLGVRARLATGFHPQEFNRSTGEMTVRDSDAHAWCEIFTPSTDWIIMDPTPYRSEADSGGWWTAIKNFWADLKFLWYENVIGYDTESRNNLGKQLKDMFSQSAAAIKAAAKAVKDGFVNLLLHGNVNMALLRFSIVVGLTGLIAEMILIFRFVRRSVRNRKNLMKTHGVRRQKLKFIIRLLKVLKKKGIAGSPHQTPMDLAARAAETLALPKDSLRRVIAFYYSIRWGGAAPTPQEFAAAEQLVADIAEQLR